MSYAIPKFHIEENFGNVNVVFEKEFQELLLKNPKIIDLIIDKSFIRMVLEDKVKRAIYNSVVQNLNYLVGCGMIFKRFDGWHINFVE